MIKQTHDDQDAATFAAYGWPVTLTDEEILEPLVALNAERAAEERRGLIRWLRPEFQNPQGAAQTALDTGEGTAGVRQVFGTDGMNDSFQPNCDSTFGGHTDEQTRVPAGMG